MKIKKVIPSMLCTLLCIVSLVGCGKGVVPVVLEMDKTYRQAVQLLENGEIQEAYDLFLSVRNYRDAQEYLDHFIFRSSYGDNLPDGPVLEVENSFCQYDSYGRVVFEYEDDISFSWTYEYNAQGYVSKATRCYFGAEESVYSYRYDAEGNITKVINPTGTTAEFVYDAQGNAIEIAYKDQDGVVVKKVTHEYNKRGDVISTEVWENLLGYVQEYGFTYQYEYDRQGNKTKLTTDGYLEEWEYDAQGRVTRHNKEFENGNYALETFTYNEYGHIVEWTRESTEQGSSAYEFRYDYDRYGNVLYWWCVDKSTGFRTAHENFGSYDLYYNPYGTWDIPDPSLGMP